MQNSYLWLKSLHLLGVVLFLGNIIVTGWWKAMADLTKNPVIIGFAQRQVTLTDYVFTAGGALILLVAGVVNVVVHGMPLSLTWLRWGLGLFVLSGLIWLFILIPTQIAQAKIAKTFVQGSVITDRYWLLCQRWYIWGLIATLLPLCNLYWMVFKTA
ncbi:DUF2269 family protein [Methylophilus methylotrophus]|uniref:DUF2269 family protein n=1 Tax=Methylophilus methylotrophus TaxID=17 RepID=UPI0003671A59|nr:DUF2269 family protein [Methylophilus methylotrophus]